MAEQAFQLGDKVVVNESGMCLIGEQGVVTYLSLPDFVHVTMECDGREYAFYPEDLDLIERPVSA